MFRRPYWRIRTLRRNLKFRLRRSGSRARDILEEVFTTARISWALLRSVLRASMFSLAILGITIGAQRFTTLPILEPVASNNQDAYDGFLISVITVIGIFLTLYLTSLNTLAGTLYVELPRRIRNLLIEEKVGNVYISFLIFLTILSLLFLSAGTLDNFRPKIVIIIVAFLSCVAVLVFTQLARRTFTFFDPTSLALILIGELNKWSARATVTGYFWHDVSFQDFYRRQAVSAVSGLVAISNICDEKQYLRQEALANLLGRISFSVLFYLPRKRQIPNDSRWYELSPHYQRWYMADHSTIAIATGTRTGLKPKMKPDHEWLEKALMAIEIEAIRKCVADGRSHVIYRILTDLSRPFEIFGHEWEVEYGSHLLAELSSTNLFAKAEPSNGIQEERKVHLASLNALGLLPITLLLGFISSLSSLNLKELSQKLSKVNWKSRENMYQLGFPTPAISALEYLFFRVGFEIEAENHVVSPCWYLRQFAFQAIAKSLRNQLDALLSLGRHFYLVQTHALVEDKQILMAVELSARGLEFYDKVRHHLPILQDLVIQLDETRFLKTLPWPQWDWEKELDNIRDIEKTLIGVYAKCIPALAALPSSTDTPDYFGQAVHLAGEEFFGALLKNEVDFASDIFAPYFFGVLSTVDSLREETSGWHTMDALLISSEPLLDLIELSGYAYIFAEYHQETQLRKIVDDIWDKYLADDEDFARLEWLAAIVSYTRNFPVITPRSLLRTTWIQTASHLFQQLPRAPLPIDFGGTALPGYSTVTDHPSLLVRTICGDSDADFMFGILDPMDVFIELCLKAKVPGRKLDFGSRVNLSEDMQRQQEREKEGGIVFSRSKTDSDEHDLPTSDTNYENGNSDDPQRFNT